MEKLVWEDKYSIGVKTIDSQHKQLFKLVNNLIEKGEIDFDWRLISDALEKMTYYARYHFATEEEYMKSIHYPEFDQHKREHTSFIKRTAELCIEAAQHQSSLPTDLIRFLREWLVAHILNTDQKITKSIPPTV